MKFKVGDRVRFVKSVIYHNKDVKLGEVYTVQDIEERGYMIENKEWFKEKELQKVEYTYKDLEKAPIGTKVTFENGEILVKDGEDFFENASYVKNILELYNFKSRILGKIIKIEEPEYQAVYESKPEILDEVEKRYLSNVIRPFRDKVTNIKKSTNGKREYITVNMVNDLGISFPGFEIGKMYKGMERGELYTLEELRL
jgi:hypothetical protein|nr:MAG TPA: hypothetical protein [Caudoviricetes sp.]